ncbi:MAG TPA: hypothetical protein VME43_13565 [Bryobacteraceae bacterium]|nr:hypothetical protein [Bryobacteraceae bacterium]
MREVLLLFRTDVHHFRLQLAAFLALMGLLGWAEAATPRDLQGAMAGMLCQWLLVPAAWYLVALAIHEHPLPGDRQYWLTRPYPRSSLVLAKALFVAAFLNLPLLAMQTAALAANGLAPLAYWRALAARQVFFTALMVLPAAAVAVVTTSLRQFAMVALAVLGVVLAMELGSGHMPAPWGGVDWMRFSAIGALAAAIFGGAVLLQYVRRKTWYAASMLAAGVVVCAAVPDLDLWPGAFAIEKRLGARPADASAIRLHFEAARDPAEGRSLLPHRQPQDNLAPLSMPVQLTGIPDGMAVLGEHTATSVQAPGGDWRNSGWQPPLAEVRTLHLDGPFWLSMAVDRGFLGSFKDRPVHLRVRAAFTLFGPSSSAILPVPVMARWVNEVGFCQTSPARFTCFSPYAHAAWVEAEARPTPPASPEPVPMRPEISYAPYPTSFGFGLWETDLDAMWMRPMPWKEIAVQTRPARAHFELDLDIPEIRLAPYSAAASDPNP